MTWCFVSGCSKKTALVDQYLGKSFSKDTLSITSLECGDRRSPLDGALRDVLSRVTSQVEGWLYEGREVSDQPLWTVCTLIVARRQYTQGGENAEHYTRAITSWSGCTHTVHTVMGKLNCANALKFRLSSTKVKFKRIEAPMMALLAERLYHASTSGGYEVNTLIGQHIRHMAGPIGGCEGVPLLPLIHFLMPQA
jgi:predicted house-cleaning NTP pyrophosphatase (Maf/HAM1 superfamily)